MSTPGYAIVLLLCQIGGPCEMVSLRPIAYADIQTCEQEAVRAINYWRRRSHVPAATLKAVCRSTDELCKLAAIHDNAPLVLATAANKSDRFKSSAVAERIAKFLRLLCRERPPSACED